MLGTVSGGARCSGLECLRRGPTLCRVGPQPFGPTARRPPAAHRRHRHRHGGGGVLSLLLAIRYLVFPAPRRLSRSHRGRAHARSRTAGLDRRHHRRHGTAGIRGCRSGIRDPRQAKPEGPPVLLLPQVDATVAWTSLVALKLRLRELSIDRPQLAIRRDESGRFHVAGFEIDTETQHDDPASRTGSCASVRSSCATRS